MKWKLKEVPKFGHYKTIVKYALLPTIIYDSNDERYLIWLEYYNATYVYNYSINILGPKSLKWVKFKKSIINLEK